MVSVPFGHEPSPPQWRLVVIRLFGGTRGTGTFCRGTLSYGIRLRRCAMQFSRARRLSFEGTMCHGAWAVSVFSNIRSRARE